MITTIKPAAGPQMVKWEPEKMETMIPPTAAAMMPAMGGKELPMAIPRDSGRAMRKIRKPESKSAFQFFLSLSAVKEMKGSGSCTFFI